MTQEEKQLLLKDLCARLPYEVKVYWENCGYGDKVKNLVTVDVFGFINDEFKVEECKPYLRPMSSMTKEEQDDLRVLKNRLVECNEDDDEKFYGIINDIHNFYYSRHIDCNLLIDKGLALEVPEDMYKTE